MSRWLTSLLRHIPLPRPNRSLALCWIGKRSLRILRSSEPDHVHAAPDGLAPEAQAEWITETLVAHDAGERWTMLMDASIAPVLQIDAAGVMLDEAGWRALAEHRFAAVLGDSIGAYRISLDRYPRSPRIACAFPVAPVDGLLKTSIHDDRRLSIVPALIHAAGIQAICLATPHWLVCVTDETCQAAWRSEERLVIGAPLPASLNSPLHTVLSQEAALMGLGDEAAPFGQAIFVGAPPAGLRAGWSEALTAIDALGRRL